MIGVQTNGASLIKSSIGLTQRYAIISIDLSYTDKCSLIVHGYAQGQSTPFATHFVLIRGATSVTFKNNIVGNVIVVSFTTKNSYEGILTLDVGLYSHVAAICSANINSITSSASV